MNRLIAYACVLLGTGLLCRACGPDFPNCYLFWDNLYVVDSWDLQTFQVDVCRVFGAPGSHPIPQDDTEKTDVADLRKCLIGDLNQPVTVVAPIIAEYRQLRQEIDWNLGLPDVSDIVSPAAADHEAISYDFSDHPDLLTKLPTEFRLYLEGAVSYRLDEVEAAIDSWKKLLDLPPAQRRYRTSWAWYMLGEAYLRLDRNKQAAVCFRTLRREVAAGAMDSLGLVVPSIGWEARALYRQRDFAGSLKLYAEMYRSGTPVDFYRAVSSVYFVMRELTDSGTEDELRLVAADPVGLQLLFAWYANMPMNDERSTDFLRDLRQRLALKPPVKGAGRLAAIAYENGRFDDVAPWLELADPDAPSTRWVKAKLLQRQGDLAGYLKGLIDLAAMTDEEFDLDGFERGRLDTEIGIALLNQGRFTEALDRFMVSSPEIDAAYVAERVLTVDELAAYIQAHADLYGAQVNEDGSSPALPFPRYVGRLPFILARRLTDLGDYDRAKLYMPQRFQLQLGKFAELRRQGADTTRSARDRATALLAAADLLNILGLELIGTELEPDWFTFDGEFDPSLNLEDRLVPLGLAAEPTRVKRHAAKPYKRFHYRYVAAELAWQAALLLPDNDPLTALALYNGGGYLKLRDPKAADRFYKALVNRCGRLPIGAAANRLRWFPTTFDVEPAE